jgi:2-desacetyl-2-hydroxyethyl bacteriochlorophyllide A dehydrogenase
MMTWMSPTKAALKRNLIARVNATLEAAGHSPLMVEHARREAADWVRVRAAAAQRRRGLYRGWGIVWTHAGRGTVELRPVEVPAAGRGEVTVEVLASVVSPGTERAYYLRLPNAQPRIPYRPGYSVAGRVLAAGPGVTHVRVGDHVAATGAPHASVATVDADRVHPIPRSLEMSAAATVMLGVISGQGVRLARIAEGQTVCVVGAGLVGVLAQRIAAAHGAGPTTVVAASRRREAPARRGGAIEFLTADEDRVAELAAEVVIEASGSPDAINTAIGAAAERGRVVLLGSPRGRTARALLEQVRAKQLEIVGAHVNTLGYEAERTGSDATHEIAASYLQALADGAVRVDDVVERRLDPREAEIFYRELAGDAGVLGAVFDWTLVPDDERARRSSAIRMPDVSGRGADSTRSLARPARGRKNVDSLVPTLDPFADARGQVGFAIVGCGDIASDNAAAMAAAPNATLRACFDVDRTLAHDLASPHGADVTDSYDEVLDRKDVDAVFLSVPHHLHAPLAEQAAAAGKHVVVEKPPANDLPNALAMVKAAEEAGVVLSVCFPHRYQADIVAARRLIEQGALGEITGLTGELLMDRSPAYRLGGFKSKSISDWRDSREKAGGGVLVMNLSHYVDLLFHLTGLEAASVSAIAGSREAAEIEDSISISMGLSNGAVGSVVGTTLARGSHFTQIRIWGSHGQVAVGHEPRFYTLRSIDGLRTTRWQRFGRLPKTDMRASFVSRFATAVTTGSPPDISAREALGVQAFMEAAYASIDRGGPVRPGDLLEPVAA